MKLKILLITSFITSSLSIFAQFSPTSNGYSATNVNNNFGIGMSAEYASKFSVMANGNGNHPFVAYTSDADCAFRIYSSGEILIGNVSPSAGLGSINVGNNLIVNGCIGIGTTPVNGYKLYVNGKIYCKDEMKVAEVKTDKINATEIKVSDLTVDISNVADYVFNEDYELKDLDEVEKYVKENRHLPGVPSGREMEREGISVSHMTNLLLEKVEELTLYMIELKKENKSLKAQIENLQKE